MSLLASDAHTERVAAFFTDDGRHIAISDFGALELASAIGNRLRSGTLSGDEAAMILAEFDSWHPDACTMITMASEDMTMATAIVRRFDLGMRAPDALHLAMCVRSGADLLTYDAAQAKAAAALGLGLAG